MKKLLLMALGCWWTASALAAIPVQFWMLDNGAKVYLMEVPGLPMVDVQLEFDAGTRRDGQATAGLAQATAMMMSKGVKAEGMSGALDENQLGEAWADLGAMVSANATTDRMSLSLRSLTRPELLNAAVDLAARQLAMPAFPDDIWQTERQRWLASIEESNTKPSVVAGRAFSKAVFGDHPYGAEPSADSLGRIDTRMMADFHARYFVPCHAKISIVGAIGRAQANELVMRLLAKLPTRSHCELLPLVAEVQPLSQAKRLDIPFESAQSHVLIGQPGISRQNPDYLPLIVGNYVLGGGGFVSRLTEQVREKRGLSYSVYSYFAPGQHAGAFTVGLQTRPDQAAQAVEVAQQVVKDFVESGPSEMELQAAKNFLIGGFALRVDSNRKLMDNLTNIAWFDLPLDYLDHWTTLVERISVSDIQQAFARHLQPERMVTVVLGPAK